MLKNIKDIKFTEGQYDLFCYWYGLEESDATWEIMQNIYDDYPEIVLAFLVSHKNQSQSAMHLSSMLSQPRN